jgi:purine nucleosidase/pyrimidine-specific ribonucleoside hydrolase
MASTRVVIDTDPGVDDAVAILFALASDALDVVGITTVAGNVNVDRTTLNARRTLDLARRPDIPVSRGAAAALNGFLRESPEVHGADGLGGLTWPEPSTPEDPRTAVQLIHQLGLGRTPEPSSRLDR